MKIKFAIIKKEKFWNWLFTCVACAISIWAFHNQLINSKIDKSIEIDNLCDEAFDLFAGSGGYPIVGARVVNRLGRFKDKTNLILAKRKIRNALSLKPNHPRAIRMNADIMWFENRDIRCIDEYGRAIAEDPNYSEAYNSLAAVYMDMCELDKALENIEIAIRLTPKDPLYHSNKAYICIAMKKYEEALLSINKSLSIDPLISESYNNLTLLFLVKKEYDDVIVAAKKALILNLPNTYLYTNLGVAYEKKKKYDEAMSSYEIAVSLDSYNYLAYVNIGNIYYEKGLYENAINFYLKASYLAPEESTIQLSLSKAYRKSNDIGKSNYYRSKASALSKKKKYIGACNVFLF